MPTLGRRALRKAPTILNSTSLYHNHGHLLSLPLRRLPSQLPAYIVGANKGHCNFSSAARHHQSKLHPINTKNVPHNSFYTTIVNNDLPARGIPPPIGSIAVVFTDIVKSTDIWEKNTDAMISAMQLHDDTIRSLTLSNEGYEVKQNGDGFMIAFSTATSAVQFCLDVQEKLLDEQWPKELLKLPPGEETTDEEGHVLFRGLQLRTSAHWGEPVSKWNEVIQRMDYLGPVVNRAARFVQVTEAGQIVVSEDFLLQLQHEMEKAQQDKDRSEPTHTRSSDTTTNPAAQTSHIPDLNLLRSKRGQQNLTNQTFHVRALGEYEFQGLDDPQKLYFIVPQSLEGRVEHWHQVTHVSGVKGNVKIG